MRRSAALTRPVAPAARRLAARRQRHPQRCGRRGRLCDGGAGGIDGLAGAAQGGGVFNGAGGPSKARSPSSSRRMKRRADSAVPAARAGLESADTAEQVVIPRAVTAERRAMASVALAAWEELAAELTAGVCPMTSTPALCSSRRLRPGRQPPARLRATSPATLPRPTTTTWMALSRRDPAQTASTIQRAPAQRDLGLFRFPLASVPSLNSPLSLVVHDWENRSR